MIYLSIVIPLYNKEESIAKTIQSVLSQTYTNFEIIVVNDGSTDDSVNNVLTINDHRIRLIQKENGGVCSARNRGINEAKYDYIALLDGDDLWDEHYLEEQVKLVQEFPEAKMWGINFAEMSNGKLIRTLPTGLPDGHRGYVDNYFQIQGRISDLYCSSSVVIKKEVFDEVGNFDERIKYAEDSDMWFRIIANYPVAFYDKYMVFYLYDAENRAMNRKRMLKYFLPYFVDKYQGYKHNVVFYRWINRWSANLLRNYYFDSNKEQLEDARCSVKKLDYAVIPTKYKILYKAPYWLAVLLNKFDKWYHR